MASECQRREFAYSCSMTSAAPSPQSGAAASGRTLTTLAGNRQRLDGGAMFGNAPKALWQRWMEQL